MHGTAPGAANVSHREPGLARVGHVQVRARVVSSAAKKVIDLSMYLNVCVVRLKCHIYGFLFQSAAFHQSDSIFGPPLGDPPRPIQTPPPIFRHGSPATSLPTRRRRCSVARVLYSARSRSVTKYEISEAESGSGAADLRGVDRRSNLIGGRRLIGKESHICDILAHNANI